MLTSPEIKALIGEAAAVAGMSVSAFVLRAAQERARWVLMEREAITLSPRDWRAFIEALDNAGEPKPKLAAAMKRHRDWLGGR